MRKTLEDTTTKIKAFYQENQKYAPVVSFLAGFTWDNLTLTRIDLFWDNLILLTYFLFAGLFIILMNYLQADQIKSAFIKRYANWYPNIIQFLFGGLISSYVVFYIQSASFVQNWLFITLLLALLIGNEFIKDRLNNLKLQIALYYTITFSFFIFMIPVLLKSISAWVFILSALISSAYLYGLIHLLYRKLHTVTVKEYKFLIYILAGIFFLFNLFYFTNIIPPVPLSLKKGAVYHHVSRAGDIYRLKYEKGSWYEFFKNSDDVFNYNEGDTVFCFASVFAPTDLNTRIYHIWQFYDNRKEKWITTDKVNYPIIGRISFEIQKTKINNVKLVETTY